MHLEQKVTKVTKKYKDKESGGYGLGLAWPLTVAIGYAYSGRKRFQFS